MTIPHFLPLIEQVRYQGRRKVTVAMPLFPGYVFLRGSRDDAFRADRTKRISNIIEVTDQHRLDWELRGLASALERRLALDPYPFLSVGRRVEVKSGPLRGLQGYVEQRVTNSPRLILAIEMLGQAVSVELHGALLDPID